MKLFMGIQAHRDRSGIFLGILWPCFQVFRTFFFQHHTQNYLLVDLFLSNNICVPTQVRRMFWSWWTTHLTSEETSVESPTKVLLTLRIWSVLWGTSLSEVWLRAPEESDVCCSFIDFITFCWYFAENTDSGVTYSARLFILVQVPTISRCKYCI